MTLCPARELRTTRLNTRRTRSHTLPGGEAGGQRSPNVPVHGVPDECDVPVAEQHVDAARDGGCGLPSSRGYGR